MKRLATIAVGAAGIGALAALGGCEILAVGALNLVETTRFSIDGDTLYMSGEINSKTGKQFDEIMAAHPQIATLVECDVPGSLDDDTMIALAYQVRAMGLNTHVTSESVIASGGVDLFLAGVERTMESGARLGVHSWSDGVRDAADYPRDAPEHAANSMYIADMLGSDAFYWFTIYAAPAADIYWMRTDEIDQYGLLTTPAAQNSAFVCPDIS